MLSAVVFGQAPQPIEFTGYHRADRPQLDNIARMVGFLSHCTVTPLMLKAY
jgi:hypothetical protein